MRHIHIPVAFGAALCVALPAAAATIQIKVPTVRVNVKTPAVTPHVTGVVGKTTLPTNTNETLKVQQTFQKIDANYNNSGKLGSDNWNATTGGTNNGATSNRDASTGQATGKRGHKPISIIKEVDTGSPH